VIGRVSKTFTSNSLLYEALVAEKGMGAFCCFVACC